MNEMTVSRHVDAPRQRVWDVVTDLDRSPEVISAIQKIERVQGDGFGLGTRWRETRTMFGREATEVMEVTAVDPPRGYVVETEGDGTHYRSAFSLTDEGDGTRLTMTFGAEPRGLVGTVMAATVGRLFARATRKAVAADLDDIARTCETDAAAS